MRKQVIVAAVAGGAVALALVAGCQDNKKKAAAGREKEELRAQSEGRLKVDQSAVLPVDVRAGVMREYPGASVQNVTKQTFNDRTVSYKVELTTKDGKHVIREFDDRGKPGAMGM
jgi:hypothetical protein